MLSTPDSIFCVKQREIKGSKAIKICRPDKSGQVRQSIIIEKPIVQEIVVRRTLINPCCVSPTEKRVEILNYTRDIQLLTEYLA